MIDFILHLELLSKPSRAKRISVPRASELAPKYRLSNKLGRNSNSFADSNGIRKISVESRKDGETLEDRWREEAFPYCRLVRGFLRRCNLFLLNFRTVSPRANVNIHIHITFPGYHMTYTRVSWSIPWSVIETLNDWISWQLLADYCDLRPATWYPSAEWD